MACISARVTGRSSREKDSRNTGFIGDLGLMNRPGDAVRRPCRRLLTPAQIVTIRPSKIDATHRLRSRRPEFAQFTGTVVHGLAGHSPSEGSQPKHMLRSHFLLHIQCLTLFTRRGLLLCSGLAITL